jgi:two-component sensor histidine kinase/CheY-like chemotaxis protein
VKEYDNDFLKFLSEEINSEKRHSNDEFWKLIVADDDEDVHAVTALALSNFTYKGKPLKIMSSYSAKETEQLIIENPDTAVIFLDVVMESHDSGLQLVKFIRETAENKLIRIVLRTGQPGNAPELKVITTFDINDYKEKTELTAPKLVTTLISSLRNYDDLRKIEESRISLEVLASTSAMMHGLDSTHPVSENIITTLTKVVKSFSINSAVNVSIFDAVLKEHTLNIQYATGEYDDIPGEQPCKDLLPPPICKEIGDSTFNNHIYFNDSSCTITIKSTRNIQRIIHLTGMPALSEMHKTMLKIFSLNISTVYNNIELLEEQKERENEIRQSLKEKLILVKEVHHRVKNNLQIISSLLNMQSSRLENPELVSIIRESENRVHSMALVHEKLYQSDLMATIDFSEYLQSLAEQLISSYCVYENIKLSFNINKIMLSINTAIPCGLIVNEILTNSIKYAFPGNRKGEIQISLHAENKMVYLKIQDNGIGMQKDGDMKKIKTLGLKLIQILTAQIDGNIKISNESGTTYTLSFCESGERES